MKRGVDTNEVLRVAARSRSSLVDEVRRAAVEHYRYRAAGSGVDALTFGRSIRPRWATIAACLTAVTLVGLLLLLVRTPESFRIGLEEDHTGLRLRVTGRVDPGLLARLRAIASETPTVVSPEALFRDARRTDPAGVAPHPASPVAPPAPAVARPAPTPASPSPPAPDQPPSIDPPPVSALPTADQAATRFAERSRRAQFRLDSGERLPISERTLIGRNPEPGPGEHVTDLVSVVDPSSSISKTHLVVGMQDEAVWIADRNSTNGTTVIDLTQHEHRVTPGEWVLVEPGSRVRIGTREMTLEQS